MSYLDVPNGENKYSIIPYENILYMTVTNHPGSPTQGELKVYLKSAEGRVWLIFVEDIGNLRDRIKKYTDWLDSGGYRRVVGCSSFKGEL